MQGELARYRQKKGELSVREDELLCRLALSDLAAKERQEDEEAFAPDAELDALDEDAAAALALQQPLRGSADSTASANNAMSTSKGTGTGTSDEGGGAAAAAVVVDDDDDDDDDEGHLARRAMSLDAQPCTSPATRRQHTLSTRLQRCCADGVVCLKPDWGEGGVFK